jgi:two-component system, response regulator YesN
MDPRVEISLRIIEAEHGNPRLRLAQVASRLHLSLWYFDRLLTAETGSGFRRHLRMARLDHARRLLVQTDMSIKAIAYEIGYKYVSAFDRDFKAIYSRTPVEWRHQRRPCNSRQAVCADRKYC